jgi:hypothetical protein
MTSIGRNINWKVHAAAYQWASERGPSATEMSAIKRKFRNTQAPKSDITTFLSAVSNQET